MRAFTMVLVTLLVTGCGSQGGDKISRGAPSVTGNGYTLYELNNNPPSPDLDLEVTGVSVLAVDSYDETKDGKSTGDIYVEDLVDPKAKKDTLADGWHGIEVFSPSFNPPALRVAPGDVVDIRGRYQLFTGPTTYPFPTGQVLPELVGGTISLRFEYNVSDPVTIDVNDLADYKTGYKWLGMLVKVENVTLAAAGKADSKGRFSAQLQASPSGPVSASDTVPAPTVTNALFDLAGASSKLPMTAGAKYKSIVGIVQYFQNFSIAPRSAQDLTQ